MTDLLTQEEIQKLSNRAYWEKCTITNSDRLIIIETTDEQIFKINNKYFATLYKSDCSGTGQTLSPNQIEWLQFNLKQFIKL